MFIYLLFWELPLLKFALTKILTCKLIQEKSKVKKRRERSETVIVLSDEKHVFP